jgi:2-oxoglutarate ferredoxin oxidoreductase subunit beta
MKVKLFEPEPFRPAEAREKIDKSHGLHPDDRYLKPGRIPHIWCPGCGLGIVLTAFIKAVDGLQIPIDRCAVVSGIGCTGRVAGYLNMDTYHTTHGRAIPFATGLKIARPDMEVVVFSGDGDLFAIGGNHFIHGARRNMDLTVLCVNNFNYGMTGGQSGPTTHMAARTTTTPYGNCEYPFNLTHLAFASGAVFVARWTTFHARYLIDSIKKAFRKPGFKFIEIVSPCPTGYGRPNRLGSGLDQMKVFRDRSEIRNRIDPIEAPLELNGPIVVGEFVDREKPTFLDRYREDVMSKVEKSRQSASAPPAQAGKERLSHEHATVSQGR